METVTPGIMNTLPITNDISDSFLEPEERDGYYVSKDVKNALWILEGYSFPVPYEYKKGFDNVLRQKVYDTD